MKRILRSVILLLVQIIGAPAAWLARWRIRRGGAIKVPQPQILLIRPDHLGDMLLVTPILQAIKARIPDAHITMMVGPWSAEVVERHPAVERLITCPFPGFQRASQKPLEPNPTSSWEPLPILFKTARQLRSAHYDLAINLRPDFWWGGALLYLAGIPRPHRLRHRPQHTFYDRASVISRG